MDKYSDAHTLEYLLAQAKEEAAQAEEKGIEKGVVKVARNLLEKGFDMETVIQVSGLSMEDIEKI